MYRLLNKFLKIACAIFLAKGSYSCHKVIHLQKVTIFYQLTSSKLLFAEFLSPRVYHDFNQYTILLYIFSIYCDLGNMVNLMIMSMFFYIQSYYILLNTIAPRLSNNGLILLLVHLFLLQTPPLTTWKSQINTILYFIYIHIYGNIFIIVKIYSIDVQRHNTTTKESMALHYYPYITSDPVFIPQNHTHSLLPHFVIQANGSSLLYTIYSLVLSLTIP